MRDPTDATTATNFPAGRLNARERSGLVQPAPGPEAPETRDKVGAQSGMVILLLAGGLFWLIVAAVVVYLLR